MRACQPATTLAMMALLGIPMKYGAIDARHGWKLYTQLVAVKLHENAFLKRRKKEKEEGTKEIE